MTATIAPPLAASTGGNPDRLVSISVNLLPDEIIASRSNKRARRAAIGVMSVVAFGVGVWFYFAHEQSVDGRAALKSAQSQSAVQSSGQQKYAGLTRTKTQIATIRGELVTVTEGNIAWNTVLKNVRAALPPGVQLTTVTGSPSQNAVAPQTPATPDASSSASPTAPSTGALTAAAAAPASLILSGTAPTKDAVSAFSNKLSKIAGIANPFVTGVQHSAEKKGVTFAIQVDVTRKSLDTRYTKADR